MKILDVFMTTLLIVICALIISFTSGCGTLQQGTRVTVRTQGFTPYNSIVNLYNNGGPGVTLHYTTDYKTGEKILKLFSKIKTGRFVLEHGGSQSFEVPLNTTGRTGEVAISFLVRKNGKVIGNYAELICIPTDRAIVHNIQFGPPELEYLKRNGKSPRADSCSNGGWSGWR